MRAALTLALAGGLLLVGCSDDAGTPLDADDLPSEVTESDSHQAGIPTVSSCGAVNTAQEQLTTSADVEDGYRYWTYDLADGTWVGVSVVEPGYPYRNVSDALGSVWEAVPGCADDEPLDELPGGAIGFTSSDADGERRGTTVLAPAGDDRIVTIAVSAETGTEPSVDPLELLADLEDRAEDLDLS